MKKIIVLLLGIYHFLISSAQSSQIDFGTSSLFLSCDPPVYTTTGQTQCSSNNVVSTSSGSTVMYYTTASGSFGQDCRNWLRLSNPGFSFIGTGSELQLRNASNGSTVYNPARFVVKNFTPGTKFSITFDIALAGYGGAFYFQCGSGQAYGDTLQMLQRDTSSFMTILIDDRSPSIFQSVLRYSSSDANTMWPNVPSYSFVSGINGLFGVYQKHTVAIFCNNTNLPTSYNYIGIKTLNPQSYDVYLDSVLDVNNMTDNLFGVNKNINSFMFSGADAICANGGPYFGDTLIVDNIRWKSDFTIFPVPVNLSSFSASYRNGAVKLNWRDETPEEGVEFQIQSSFSGGPFKTIGRVVEKDNKYDYSFGWSPSECGKYLFRLAFEGKTSAQIPITVPCAPVSIKQAGKQVVLTTESVAELRITNIFGQIISKEILPKGQTVRYYDKFAPGMYVTQIITRDGITNTKQLLFF